MLRCAIVTGSSKGIGLAIARRLGEDGFAVIGCARTPGAAEAAAAALRSDGLDVIAMTADVGVQKDVEDLLRLAVEHAGRVDVLVNNAGVFARSNVLELTVEDWNRTIAANLTGPFMCIQAAARAMLANDGPVRGRIVNITSTAAVLAEQEAADYNATKGGLAQLSRSVAVDLAPHGILCNCVAPGYVATEIDADYVASLTPQQRQMMNPLAREADPAEIAHLVATACDERTTFMTGTTIFVDGGQTAVATRPG
jgi:NAD(P)-dependent dehydrogenase (short-subunit alcohol dehydrogenase family)